MKDTIAPIASGENRILASLPPVELQRISLKSETVELRYEQVFFRCGDVIAHVFFPLTGIISLLSQVDAESMIEVGLIGREGMVGIGVYLGARNATNMAVVQGNGEAQRMRTADFLAICAKRGELPVILRRFAQSRLSQVSQLAACYRFHQTEARFARWLLMTADRMATAEFQITQEFLSNMLGVRREAVNKSAIALDELGLISHSRGHISIIDRPGLEAAACSCYKILKSV
jgi:CRP-like cAMP-binding protein